MTRAMKQPNARQKPNPRTKSVVRDVWETRRVAGSVSEEECGRTSDID